MNQQKNLSIFDNLDESIIALRKAFKEGSPLSEVKSRFNNIIYHYYATNRRSFSWRDEISPYRVVVSEIMLQQTQTDRVINKFKEFIGRFPSFESLAKASFEEVLRAWKGLGYNRRAQSLHEIAKIIMQKYNGQLPNNPEVLVAFKGIGPATAASICTFAFNRPTVFIETNIRTVFIFCFFHEIKEVRDKEILKLIEQMLDKGAPRDWYYALMDYGTMLKKTIGNLCRLSAHYNKQSRFEGSDRQLRGQVLQLLLDQQIVNINNIPHLLNRLNETNRVNAIITDLERDRLIKTHKGLVQLT